MRLRLFLLLWLSPVLALAQFTTVTATVTTLQSATYTFDFVNQASGGPPLLGGISVFPTTVTGAFDASGHLSVSLADNNQVTPIPSQWRLSVALCKGSASGPIGFHIQQTITGTTVDLSSALTAALPSIPTGCNGGGGGSGSVQPAPQFRLFIQPNAGTQAVAGPASTAQNAVTPLLQGVGNTDMFATGGGNNGIANFFSTYPTGLANVPPTSTDTESPDTTVGSGAVLLDLRSNGNILTTRDVGQLHTCAPQMGAVNETICESDTFTLPRTAFHRLSYLKAAGPGYDLGSSGTSAILWSNVAMHVDEFDAWSRGIKSIDTHFYYCIGVGDCNGPRTYGTTYGGAVASADEGGTGGYFSMQEATSYIHATIATGGSTGSTSLTSNFVSGANLFQDGGYLLDITKGTLSGTVTDMSFPTVVASGTPFMAWDMSGVTMPVSTAWGVSNSATVNYTASTTAFSITGNTITVIANNSFAAGELAQLSNVPPAFPYLAGAKLVVLSTGLSSTQFEASFVYPNVALTSMAATASVMTGQFQYPVHQTINFTLGTLPSASAPFAVGNNACIVKEFAEQVPITAVGTPSAGVQSVTFSTRYGYATSFLLMQGGMCGQYPTKTSATWRTAIMAVGSLSSSQVILAACTHGTCTTTGTNAPSSNLVNQAIGGNGTAISFYPGAEIIGTNGGTLNSVQLATNTVPWANGDTIEGPHPPAVNTLGLRVIAAQTTPMNDSLSGGLLVTLPGPSLMDSYFTMDGVAPVNHVFKYDPDSGSPAYGDYFYSRTNPTTAVINYSDAPDVNLRVFHGPSPSFNDLYSLGGGGWRCLTGASYCVFDAQNIPAKPVALAQFPISTQVDGGHVDYQPVNMSGDCTLAATGAITCTSSNGRPAFLPLAPNALALPTGAIAANTCTSATTLTVTGTGAYQVDSITAWSITSNMATFTATNTLVAGQTIWLSAFGTSTFFNGANGVVLTTGLSGSQFEIAFTHANGSATEAGTGTGIGSRIITTPTGDWSGLTGYGSNAGLSLVVWPTVNTVNVKICNGTASSITPGAALLDEEVHP